MYVRVPTYDNGTWTHTEFETRQSYVDFLWTMFKEPGQYEFDETAFLFNERARFFNENKVYTFIPKGTREYHEFFDIEKERSRKGVIYKNNGKTWFCTFDYYWLVNYSRIYNKEKKKFSFPDVRDVQYHMALYEELAKHMKLHATELKKRQMLSSYYHCAKIINYYWFEEGAIIKMAASLKAYLDGVDGIWPYLEEYANFLNANTPWYRESHPGKVLNWIQQQEIEENGRTISIGNKSKITGKVLDKDPTNGVGGAATYFYHEEAGVAPKMDKTLEFLLPALKSGEEYTGQFCTAGTVGELKDCGPLKAIVYNPKSVDVLGVKTNLLDDKGKEGVCALFIPEQYGYMPYVDQYGNSLVKEALEAIKKDREQWQKDLTPSQYQLRVSQHPININEAFAYRDVSPWPVQLVDAQIRRIEEKQYFEEYVDLERDENGKLKIVPSNKLPITEFPIKMNLADKEGVIVMYERPVVDNQFGLYFGSIDPVATGKTSTSNSLCSITIYKNRREKKIIKADGKIEYVIEKGGVVCTWAGRFDNLDKTHERLENIIEIYKAWTIVENNVSLFIVHMINKKKQQYLVPKDQILFLKELEATTNIYQEYGWRNIGDMYEKILMPYGIQYLKEEIDQEVDKDGNILKTYYGVERIPDIMILKEMLAYGEKNFDRLISFCSLIAFVKIQEASRGLPKKTEEEDPNKKMYSEHKIFSPFHNIGKSSNFDSKYNLKRSAFKTLK